MRKTLLFLYLLSLGSIAAYGQTRLTQDPKLERQLHESGLIHQPLPLDIENSFETNGWKKEVLQSAPLTRSAGTEGWSHSGAGSMSFSTEKTVSGKGSIKLQFSTFTGKRATGSPSDPDYATYGNSSVTYHLDGANLEKYNRIVFSIYPDCDGARIVNMNLTFRNADTPAKKGYNQPSGSHLINLINKEWNQCFLEIDEYQRDKVMSITFSTALKGKDRTTGDSAIYYLDNLQLQTVKAPEKVSGWIPADGKISYSTTGYAVNHPKTALINTNLTIDAGKRFQLLTTDGKVAYEGDIRKEKTTLGEFGLIDFT
ncbi:glycosyl hydrolase family 9, partial [Bacteroides uniformis]